MVQALNISSSTWFTLSVWPSVCGWYAELLRRWVPRHSWSCSQKRETKTNPLLEMVVRGTPCNNGDGDPDLPSGRGNYCCGREWHTDPASDRKIEPYNLSTTTHLVISRDTNLVDLAKKANPYLRNEEHKQEHNQITDVWLISQAGVSQTDERQNCSWQNNLSKTRTLMEERQLFMKTLGYCKTPGCTPNGPKHDTWSNGPKDGVAAPW